MKSPLEEFLERPGPQKRYFSDLLNQEVWPAFLRKTTRRRLILGGIAVATLLLDYLTGPTIRIPAFYALPILLLAWYEGFPAGLSVGAMCVAARLAMEQWVWKSTPWAVSHSLWTALLALGMLAVLTWYAARAGRLSREVRLLWGVLPICTNCLRVRNEENEWERFDLYFIERSKIEFTRGLCRDCLAGRPSRSPALI